MLLTADHWRIPETIARWALQRRGLPMDDDRADEVRAVLMVELWRCSRRWRPDGGACFATFAFTALRWAAIRALRGEEPKAVHFSAFNVDEDADIFEPADRRPGPALEVERQETVAGLLVRLSSRERATVEHLMRGGSCADAARALGLSRQRVGQIVADVRRKARAAGLVPPGERVPCPRRDIVSGFPDTSRLQALPADARGLHGRLCAVLRHVGPGGGRLRLTGA